MRRVGPGVRLLVCLFVCLLVYLLVGWLVGWRGFLVLFFVWVCGCGGEGLIGLRPQGERLGLELG